MNNEGLTPSICPVKNIGKPCAGKPHARFDEEGRGEPAPYSTQNAPECTALNAAEPSRSTREDQK